MTKDEAWKKLMECRALEALLEDEEKARQTIREVYGLDGLLEIVMSWRRYARFLGLRRR